MKKPTDNSLMGRVLARLECMADGETLTSVQISDDFDVPLSSVRPALAKWVQLGWLTKSKRGALSVYGLGSLAGSDAPADEAAAPFNCALYLDGDLMIMGGGVDLTEDGAVMLRASAVATLRSYLDATRGVGDALE